MAEISNRAVATAAAGALLAVGLAFVGSADAAHQYGPQQLDAGPKADRESLRLGADRRTVTWVDDGLRRAAPIE